MCGSPRSITQTYDAARYTAPDTGATVQLVTRDRTAPGNPVIAVNVDDVDAAYAEAQQRGYDILPGGFRRLADDPGIERWGPGG